MEEAQFAIQLGQRDSGLSRAIFLTPGASSGWMAVLSNKIPLDVKYGNFLPISAISP